MTRAEAIEKIKRWKLEVDDEKDYADYLEGWFYKDDEIAFDTAIEALQEQKMGKWIQISPAKIYECSECAQNVMTGDIDVYKYCHGCGAKMEVQND